MRKVVFQGSLNLLFGASIFQTSVIPVLILFGCEIWTLEQPSITALEIFKLKSGSIYFGVQSCQSGPTVALGCITNFNPEAGVSCKVDDI